MSVDPFIAYICMQLRNIHVYEVLAMRESRLMKCIGSCNAIAEEHWDGRRKKSYGRCGYSANVSRLVDLPSAQLFAAFLVPGRLRIHAAAGIYTTEEETKARLCRTIFPQPFRFSRIRGTKIEAAGGGRGGIEDFSPW